MHERIRQTFGLPTTARGGPPQADYCRYAGVVEHGASGEHHHAHVLWVCRDIPEAWKRDPNAGRARANARSVRGADSL